MEFAELVKQIYFYCENKNPKGIYPTEEVDLLEFATKLIAVWEERNR